MTECYTISNIFNSNYEPEDYTIKTVRKEYEKKIPVFVNTGKNNFRDVLFSLPKVLPNIYSIESYVGKKTNNMITNNNRGDFLVWYLDGSKSISSKDNLQKVSKYAITDKDDEKNLYISKPVHYMVGSGKYIKIGTKSSLKKRSRVYLNKEPLKFIIQPLISNKLLFWENERKFDLRMYMCIYATKGKIYYYNHPYGVARLCLHKYNPINDYSSAITNISIQEKLEGYTTQSTLKLVKDDIGLGKEIQKDLKSNLDLFKIDPSRKNQILILGLDVLLLNDGTFRIIEINEGPYLPLNFNTSNMETVASYSFIMKVWGKIIPNMFHDEK